MDKNLYKELELTFNEKISKNPELGPTPNKRISKNLFKELRLTLNKKNRQEFK